MPRDKDLKRLVRSRMRKTGESYTAARAQVMKRRMARPRRAAAAGEAQPGTPPSHPSRALPAQDFAALAGISDASVQAKTGCDWSRWVHALDQHGCAVMTHTEIAKLVKATYGTPDWWAQTVTTGYERIRGLRVRGQRRDGSYEANKSRTLDAAATRLFDAFADAARRRAWLDVDATVRTSRRAKYVRFGWPDGSVVVAGFTPKGRARSSVTIQHEKLPTAEAAARMKAFWSDRLDTLARLLTS